VVYSYAVSAVDLNCNESAQVAPSVWPYRGISYDIMANYSYGLATPAAGNLSGFTDTTGSPAIGPYDIKAQWGVNGGGGTDGGFLLVMGNGGNGKGNQTIFDDLEVGAFIPNGHLVFDIQTTATRGGGTHLAFIPQSRAYGDPRGTNPDNESYIQVNVQTQCSPVNNTWTTCRIPLSLLPWGNVSFTGFLAGTGTNLGTLTVCSIQSHTNIGIVPSLRIAGNGTPGNTYVLGSTPTPGVYGTAASDCTTHKQTYLIAGPSLTASTSICSAGAPCTFTGTDTTVYKIGWQWINDTNAETVYLNNIGLTPN
jgi:hypothetical protein